jgi:MGT family glycosyltransferase
VRVLFVVPPFAGHVNPTVAVGVALERRGHAVAWTGPPGAVDRLLPGGAAFLPSGPDPELAPHRPAELRGAAAFRFLWEQVLLPLGHAMVDGVEGAVAAWQPDVVVADQQALAGTAVAVRHGLPWATSATTSAELVDPLVTMPRAQAWLDARVAAFAAATGLGTAAPARVAELRLSPHLVLVFSTPRLVDPDRRFPPHYAFVGPSLADRRQDEPFPWDRLAPDRPRVLVTLGTVNATAGARFFATAAAALAGEPAQAVVVAPPELVGTPPGGAIVRPRVPQLALLPRLDAVVCHAGHNTVCEALAHGVPLVVAPIRDDQPVVAEQVVRAGAGVRVRFGRVDAAGLRHAVRQVLDDPAYRAAAAEVRASFQAAGGPTEAARRLEALVLATTRAAAHDPGPGPDGSGTPASPNGSDAPAEPTGPAAPTGPTGPTGATNPARSTEPTGATGPGGTGAPEVGAESDGP